ATSCSLQRWSSRDTSSVVRGKATSEGAGAWTLVQSFPYAASSAGSLEAKSGEKSEAMRSRKAAGSWLMAACVVRPPWRCKRQAHRERPSPDASARPGHQRVDRPPLAAERELLAPQAQLQRGGEAAVQVEGDPGAEAALEHGPGEELR